MSISSIYNIIVCIHPRIEVFFRKLYWTNISMTSRFKPKNKNPQNYSNPVNFDNILYDLRQRDIKKGDLIIVHSSDETLKRTEKSPKDIIIKLLDFIGTKGTLAMPVFRKYKDELTTNELLNDIVANKEFTYDVQKTPIWTGLLPRALLKAEGVYISRFPLNPLAAIGNLAKLMMKNNLDGEILLPHGVNSSWKFCVDHDAIIIGLGIDLVHSLTITHTIEDCAYPNWPVKEWYSEKKFKIVDKEFEERIKVLERKAKWGMLYIAEKNFRKDLLGEKILTTNMVDGIRVEVVHSKNLYKFLQEKNKKQHGYPYYAPTKFINDENLF
jgi:aminoglycoside 3-N-acetyltransferase